MMQPQSGPSTLGRLARRLWLFRRLYAHISALQAELSAAGRREAEVLQELRAAVNREAGVLQELASTKGELTASVEREAKAMQKLASAKSELIASNEELAEAKGEVLACRTSLLPRLDDIRSEAARLQEHVYATGNNLASRFEDAKAVFLAQLPLLTANLAALRSGHEDDFRLLRNRLNRSGAGGSSVAADLYLDLLETSLTGMLRSDVSQAPWTGSTFEPARRGVGRDWPSQAETMIGTARMKNLRSLVTRALDENVPGDLIETGVWRGGACIYMRGILAAVGDTRRRVFVADSFRGLPLPDEEAFPADAGDPHHTFDQLAVSRAEVEANFRRYALLDEQVVFLEGWFKDTLPAAPIDQLAVLRLDGDMYGSTMDALNALYFKVSPGGYVVVDDYVLKACAKAVDDFRSRHGISAPMHDVDGAAIWWQVPKESPIRRPNNFNSQT